MNPSPFHGLARAREQARVTSTGTTPVCRCPEHRSAFYHVPTCPQSPEALYGHPAEDHDEAVARHHAEEHAAGLL